MRYLRVLRLKRVTADGKPSMGAVEALSNSWNKDENEQESDNCQKKTAETEI